MIKSYGDKKLSKTGSHRASMFRNMMTSLVMNEKLVTTNAKAKELRRFFDTLINDAKQNNYSRVRSGINGKEAFEKLTKVLAQRFKERNSGYTSLINVGYRKGDNTLLTMIKLVD
ncbi:MAG TPA: 50S ribosomal protein L17 [Elusimicrobiales bacterium]|nr:50S ribosomal protein L17 [Elusimicrobiales bacterium]HOL61924.1 50S ribosomal protein L17 [Elusimicrobiales bacterium]HPO96255.1 50S ribosomal protein L17 [Elusimicrobiales bacterium]